MANEIFEELKRRVLQFEIRPGERLFENDLALEWQTSRTPVREACKRLVQAGLVRVVPRRGYYVREVNLPEIEHLYEVRVVLEAATVSLAIERSSSETWTTLACLWSEVPDSLPCPETMLDADERFHLAIANAATNSILVECLHSINERIRAIRAKDFTNPDRIRATYRQHHDIVKLILQRDVPAASAAMRTHILESKTYAIAAVKELLAMVCLAEGAGRNVPRAAGREE